MPMLLTARSNKREYLDENHIAVADLHQNLVELDIINRLLGGHKASGKGLKAILREYPRVHNLLDIGFGGGDSIFHLDKLCRKLKRDMFFYGADLKRDCLLYAENHLAGVPNKKLMCTDYRNLSPEMWDKMDIIHCSLFLHHLSDDEIIHLFQMARFHKCVLLINDLHRHWLAYYSIKLLTSLFSRSWLVKSDAPLSVRKGFRKIELKSLLQVAGFSNYTIKWSWPFRYIVIAKS